MSFQTYHLSNGIPVHIKQIPTSFKVCMDILVAAGSWKDPVDKQGLAHFLEHMMFRGTKKRDHKQISIDTLKIGGYLNAFTERDSTTYTLDVPYRQALPALDILLDLFLDPQFPEEGLDKEKTIILEEIDMYNDIPTEFLMDRFIENLFPSQSMGAQILGTKESVKNITREDITQFYDQWYYDNSLTISIAGRINPEEILPILEDKLGSRVVKKNASESFPCIQPKKHAVRYHREVDQGQVILGVQAPGLEDPDRLAIQVMNAILGGNEISRLYQIIREEQGLAYAVDASHEAWLGAGCFYVSVGLDSTKIEQVEKIILNEWQRIKTDLVSDEELLVAKNSLEGSKIMELEGAGAYNSHIGAMAVRGLPADPEEELDLLQKVTAEDVRQVARRILDTDHYILTALLPRKKSYRRS
jgi:predicted Zn-dependent peptidase